MFDLNKYHSLCNVLQAVLKKGRGGIYLGGYEILGADAFGRQIISDSRHLPSLKMMYVPPFGETCLLAFMMCAIQQGMVFVDVGAGCGYYSIQASELVGKQGKVYAFEFIPECLHLFGRNLEINRIDNVIGINQVVSNRSEKAKKKYFGNNYNFFFYENNGQGEKEIETQTTSLDEYFDGKESCIDLVKINSEKDLPNVFSGMKEMVTYNKDIKILCAFNKEKIGKNGDWFLSEIIRQNFEIFLMPSLDHIEPEELLCHTTTKNILLARA